MNEKIWPILAGGIAASFFMASKIFFEENAPDSCFRSNADNKLYLVDKGIAKIANNRWQMNEEETLCFIPDNGNGPSVIVPVIEYP